MSDTELEQDLTAQQQWMIEQSQYQSVDHLYACNPDLYIRLAMQWREAHSVI